MMLQLVRLEQWRIYRKPRSWIALAAIGVLVGVVHVVIYLQGDSLTSLALQGIEQVLQIEGRYVHGYLVAFIVQGLLLVHLPFLVTLVAGDLLAGEAAAGTLRILFLQPIARWKFLLAKVLALAFYVASIVVFLATVALGGGIVLFGVGDLVVLKSSGVVVLSAGDVLWRFGCAYCFNWLGLMTVALLALLLGSFTENALGPVIGAMAVVIVMTAITLLDVPLIARLSDWFFTTHAAAWRMLFDEPLPVGEILRSAVILLVHCIVFFIVTAVVIERRDILS
jgi:ABC-2 type transport system permease protein